MSCYIANIIQDADLDIFVAHVPELDIYSQGRTLKEARVAIEDAIESYLTVSCEKNIHWGNETIVR